MLQQALTFDGQLYVYLAPVFFPANPLDQASLYQSVHQFDCAVVLNLEAFREVADRWLDVPRRSFDGEHQLVMLRLKPGLPGCFLAEPQETPDLVAKLRQGLVVRGFQAVLVSHDNSPRYYRRTIYEDVSTIKLKGSPL